MKHLNIKPRTDPNTGEVIDMEYVLDGVVLIGPYCDGPYHILIKDDDAKKYNDVSEALNSYDFMCGSLANSRLSLDPRKIRQIKRVDSIVVQTGKLIDLHFLQHLNGLKKLKLNTMYKKGSLKFEGELRNIIELDFKWDNQAKESFMRLSKLETLRIHKFKISENVFANFPKLNKLGFVQYSNFDINYLANIPQLKKLQFFYGKSIIDNLSADLSQLKELNLQNNSMPIEMKFVNHIDKLEILTFLNCKSISSLAFIKYLPNLKLAYFLGTPIMDGKLNPLLDVEDIRVSPMKKSYILDDNITRKLNNDSIGLYSKFRYF